MPFALFASRLPDVARRETRSVLEFDEGVQKRAYLFQEMFCDEAGCDCRRAFIMVYSDEKGASQPRATLSWGWEPDAFYREWARFPLEDDDLEELRGPALARLGQQTEEADHLLEKFRELLKDKAYAARIVRHYEGLRARIERAPRVAPRDGEAPLNRSERRRLAKEAKRPGKR